MVSESIYYFVLGYMMVHLFLFTISVLFSLEGSTNEINIIHGNRTKYDYNFVKLYKVMNVLMFSLKQNWCNMNIIVIQWLFRLNPRSDHEIFWFLVKQVSGNFVNYTLRKVHKFYNNSSAPMWRYFQIDLIFALVNFTPRCHRECNFVIFTVK